MSLSIKKNLTWGPHIRYLCKSLAKRVYQSAKIKNFLTFNALFFFIFFFQAHIQSRIDYASTLWDSASESIKALKSLHRRAIKIILLKTNKQQQQQQNSQTMTTRKLQSFPSNTDYNKARFMHRIVSGKAPTYFVKKVSVNLYSRNYSRKLNIPMPRLDLFVNLYSRNYSKKLNIPMPRLDLFKSSLINSGPTLWNSLPIALTEPSTVSVFKHRLSTHMLTSLGTT